MIQEVIIKHGQKFTLWTTPVTSTSLDASEEDLFLKTTPLSAFLCSQPALVDACTDMVNYMSLRSHFKSRLPLLFEDLFCKWELGGHMKSANCLFSARREQSVLYHQGYVLLKGFQVCTSFVCYSDLIHTSWQTSAPEPSAATLRSMKGVLTLQAEVRVERKKGKEETKFVPWFFQNRALVVIILV